MGIRFRKRISIFPWLKLNISKSGFSTTIGPKGFNANVGAKGSFLNTGIPGTGLYSRNKIGGTRAYTKQVNSIRSIGCLGTTVIKLVLGFFTFIALISQLYNIREHGWGNNGIDVYANIGTICVFLMILYFIFRKNIKNLLSNDEDEISIVDDTYQDTTQSSTILNNSESSKEYQKNENTKKAEYLLKESPYQNQEDNQKRHIDCHVDTMSQPVNSIPPLSELSEEVRRSFEELSASFKRLSRTEPIWNPPKIDNIDEIKDYKISKFCDSKIRLYCSKLAGIRLEPNTPAFALSYYTYYFCPNYIIRASRSSNLTTIPYENNIRFYNIYCLKDSLASWNLTVVDKTWKYRTKDGNKDYRHKSNNQMAIVRYVVLEIGNDIVVFNDVNSALDFNRKLSNLLCLQGISIPELV